MYYFENFELLNLFCHQREGDVYVIAHKQPDSVSEHHFHQQSDQPEIAAYELYYLLREADESNTICIAIELPPAQGKWQGIRERILKAGFPYSIDS
jgi:L-threonylcarbamoyladenylate synthase